VKARGSQRVEMGVGGTMMSNCWRGLEVAVVLRERRASR
jgi:hypothetical protein